MTITDAKKLRSKIEKMAENLPDDEILNFIDLCSPWKSDTDYVTGDRVKYDGFAYKCLQSHKSQDGWNPKDAVSLWAKIINEGIPDWEQPDSTNPYMRGDKVRYKGKIYESVIDNNVWSPDDYPAGWKEVG